ncbi:MAG TPA: hypothetical protein VN453_01830, partial [Feifaniaceae bacterium]|nr:hypothetical protein [Feifaniaceae bacterium]
VLYNTEGMRNVPASIKLFRKNLFAVHRSYKTRFSAHDVAEITRRPSAGRRIHFPIQCRYNTNIVILMNLFCETQRIESSYQKAAEIQMPPAHID